MHRLTLALALGAVAATATAAPRSAADRARYQACLAALATPDKAIEMANGWRAQGGGLPARHCLAMAYLKKEQFGPAALALEQAARAAEAERDPAAADLWGQAGNAALLQGDAAKAQAYLSSALALATKDDERRAGLLIDRARANVELNKTAEARADLDAAVKLLPGRPEGWLLRATLARRAGDIKQAASDIAEAAKLAPDDPDVRLEQGNIAGAQGHDAEARAHWQAAVKADPQSPAGQAAAKALAANPG